MKIVQEGAWDCSTPGCNETGIRASLDNCPSCGEPQNSVHTPEEDFYLPSGAREVTDPDELRRAEAGPDWNCGHCGARNRGWATACRECDRPKDADDTVNRRTEYSGSGPSSSTDWLTERRRERIEEPIDEANRIVEGGGEVPRIMDDIVLPYDELPREGPAADERAEFAEEVAEYGRLKNMSPVGRAIDNGRAFVSDNRRPIMIGGGVVALVAVIVGAVFFIHAMLATHKADVTVQSRSWQRQVEVEEYRTLSEEGWSHPSDAYNIDSFRAQDGWRTVIDGYRTEYFTAYRSESYSEPYTYSCNPRTVSDGNGYFHTEYSTCSGTRTAYRQVPYQDSRQVPITHQEPVYRTRYRYNIDRWVTDHWVVGNGGEDQPVWPEPSAADLSGGRRVGSGRRETYTVVVVDEKGKSYSETTDLATWNLIKTGDTLTANFNRNDKLVSIDWPEAAVATS